MPDFCLTMRCIDCESHAIVSGKLDCNYMNRLGLAQPTVRSFLQDMPQEKSVEELDAEYKEMEEQQKLVNERLEELKKKKQKIGGEVNVST